MEPYQTGKKAIFTDFCLILRKFDIASDIKHSENL